jgi:hypothetical protein
MTTSAINIESFGLMVGLSFSRFHLITGTSVAPVKKATAVVLADRAELEEARSSLASARAAADSASADLLAEAHAAGLRGGRYDPHAAQDKKRAVLDAAEVATAVYEAASGRLISSYSAYLSAVAENAEALRVEALSRADSSVRSLTTARMMADRATAGLQSELNVLSGLQAVARGEAFAPGIITAGGDISQAPAVHAALAIEPLDRGIAFAVQVLAEVRGADERVAPAEPSEPAQTTDIRLLDGAADE